jgi:hypothetical protein
MTHLLYAVLIFACCHKGDDIDLLSIKKQYDAAFLKAKNAYNNLSITETREFTIDKSIPKDVVSGSLCGDFVKYRFINANINRCDFLLKRSQLSLRYNEMTKSWILKGYSHPVDLEAYETCKRNTLKVFPKAFSVPFASMFDEISVQDILDGKSSPSASIRGSHPVTLDKAERIMWKDKSVYRLSYTIHVAHEENGISGHFDVAPELSWMIIHGKFSSTEWEIEYGQKIHDVPVAKLISYGSWRDDKETQEIRLVPIFAITVDKAEAYDSVNPEEYEPAFYGIQVPDETENKIPFLVLSLGLVGILSFIVGILMIVRAQRRARLRTGSVSG